MAQCIVEDEEERDEFLAAYEDYDIEPTDMRIVLAEELRAIKEKKVKKRLNTFKRWEEATELDLERAEYPDLDSYFHEVFPDAERNRELIDITKIFEHNAWDNVQWDDEMKKEAIEKVELNSSTLVGDERKAELEEKAAKYWDDFYGIHKHKFFRDRNWLLLEFPELESPFGTSVPRHESAEGILRKRQNEKYPGENSRFKVLEVGCGAGNLVFPLLNDNNNPELYVYCCDFSKVAVDVVKNSPRLGSDDRCTPFVLDITCDNPEVPFPLGSIDAVTLVFVFSAISPEKFDQAIRNVFSFLKPGGCVLFRDYGRYDMAQLRIKDGKCISENFYCRGDGTRVYFFLTEQVEDLFSKGGFVKEKLMTDRRLQVNRLRSLRMYRIWIQGKFVKPSDDDNVPECLKENVTTTGS